MSWNNSTSDTDAIAIGGLPFNVKTNTYSSGSQINQNGSGFSMSVFADLVIHTYICYRSDSDSSTGLIRLNYNEVGRLANAL